MGELQKSHNSIKHDYFPIYINSNGKKAVFIGGGNIAARRIKTLSKFNFEIVVISPEINEEIKELEKNGKITFIKDSFKAEYLEGAFLVVAATNNREVNEKVGRISKENNIFVSVADKKEECSFYFPAIADDENIVVGICGNGSNHKEVSEKAEGIRNYLNKEADIN